MRHSRLAAIGYYTGLAVLGYAALAYMILPFAWTHYEHQTGLSGQPMRTSTAEGIPGDPINAGLVGTKDDVTCAMQVAGWRPADPRTLRSSVEIAGSVILDRPYPGAPVSPLLYQGRPEDLAFEKVAGRSGPASSRPLLAGAGHGRGRPPRVARRRHLRSKLRVEPLHRRDHAPHRA